MDEKGASAMVLRCEGCRDQSLSGKMFVGWRKVAGVIWAGAQHGRALQAV